MECKDCVYTKCWFRISPLTTPPPPIILRCMATTHPVDSADILAQMTRAASVSAALANLDRNSGRTQITKVRYTHDAMIDLIVANPAVSQNELASHFGYSPAWVSIVLGTDMFKARLEARREEIVDPVIRASLNERFTAMVTRSLEVLQEKLSRPADSIPDNLALRAAELGAKALGIGGNAPPAPPTIAADHLSSLADRLIALQKQARPPLEDVIDVTPRPAT